MQTTYLLDLVGSFVMKLNTVCVGAYIAINMSMHKVVLYSISLNNILANENFNENDESQDMWYMIQNGNFHVNSFTY